MFDLTTGILATDTFTLGFGWPGGPEWIVLLVLGLLIFGRRLPEVGRSLGRGIVEFKKGIKGIEDEIETESSNERLAPKSAAHLESSGGEKTFSASSATVESPEPR
ncbi:MAG: twin-arginine translocase TatA/TatE family subunit [Phycisphaerales bacterium]|nr:twin-arginine translocase TatA/TatE family subunit [Phycisphaerales bacterium]